MKRILLALAILIAATLGARSQTNVSVIGPVVPGDCVTFNSSTVLKDAGVTCNNGSSATPGGVNGSIQYNNGGNFGGFVMSGDCLTNTTTGVITCTKTSGVSLGTFATQNYATPPPIGGTTPNTGSFSTLTDTGITGLTQCVQASTAGLFSGTGASCVLLAGNNTFTGTNTFTGDVIPTSGDPYCNVVGKGAVHNGSTDDSAAFQACFTQCLTTRATGACTVFVPPQSGIYCIKNTVNFNTGFTYNGGIILMGGGVQGTVISACGTNANLFYMNNQWAQIKQMTIYGYGSFASDPVFTGTPPTTPTILMGPGCSQCRIQDLYVIGGTAAIALEGACGYTLDNVWASGSYGDGVHVAGYVYEISCGGTIWNSHFDQVYPVLQPTHGITIAAWQASHAYATVGTIVTVTCNSRSAYIQLKTAGTSAGSQPNCAVFGQNMTDNTAVWQFVNFGSMACLNLDTGSIETEIIQTDMTCDNDYNLSFTNSFAGTAPTQNSVIRSTPGGAISSDVNIQSTTSHLTMMGVEAQYCAAAGCSAVLINGVSTNINISGLDCFNGIAYCVSITQPANSITVTGMHASGADTADFSVSAAATGWMLTNSTHATGSGFFYSVGAVAANHYRIQTNICNGATGSDAGTGTAKVVEGCTGTNP